MASIALTLADYLEDQVEELVVDTNLFAGGEYYDSAVNCTIVDEVPGGVKNESGMIDTPIQVLVKNTSYETGNTLAYSIYDVLANKPGLDIDGETIYYSQDFQRPVHMGKDDRSRYIFSTTFLLRRS